MKQRALKRTFYPLPEINRALSNVPQKKLSSRVNLLLLKGLASEKKEETAMAYFLYNKELGKTKIKASTKKPPEPLKRLFQDEDELEGWF